MHSPLSLGPQPTLGYVGSPIDRVAERREDSAFLAAAVADANARSFLIAGDLVVLARRSETHTGLFTPAELAALGPPQERVFLGLEAGAPRFGTLVTASANLDAVAPARTVIDMRSIAVQGLIPSAQQAGLAEAKALLHWHANYRFCARCGAPSRTAAAGWKRVCPACKAEHFPRTDPVVIMLAIRGESCLLGRQSRFATNMWSCLAGFIEPGETLEEAVRRETLEEAGIVTGRIRYFASQPWPIPMNLMLGCFAEALTEELTVDLTELEDARWVTRAEAAQMLTRTHPDGIISPPPHAIAHHLLRAFVEGATI